MTRNRSIDLLLVMAFAAALLAPVICQLAGWDLAATRHGEKRTPAPLPQRPGSLSGVREFPRQVDAWYKDHFGLRRLLIAAHARLLHDVLRTSPHPAIMIGQEDWLFYDSLRVDDGDTLADARGTKPLSPYALEYWRWMFEGLQAYYADRHIPFYAVLVPTKELVYPEFLPAWATRISDASAIDDLCSHMRRRSRVPVLNLSADLRAAKSGAPLYFRCDTHWNAEGAFCGYRAIMNLIRDVPRLAPPLERSDLRRQEYRDYGGDLSGMAGISRWIGESVVDLQPAHSTARRWRVADYETADAISTNANTTLPRAMFIRDSFSVGLIPFFQENFSYAYYRWCHKRIDPTALSVTNIDVAVMIFSDRHMRIPLAYPARIMESLASQRFATGEPLARFTPAELAGQPLSPLLSMAPTTNRLQLRMGREGEADLVLPAFPLQRGKLPIVEVELTSKRGGDLSIVWDSDRADGVDVLENRVSVPVRAGRSIIHLPLLDPEMKGAARLRIPSRTFPLEIHAIEVRSIPR